MALMTGAQYKESLKKLRPNIYKFGELIEDVTTHPATKLHVESVAHSYDMAFDEKKAAIYTTTSFLSGQKAHRWNTLMTTMEDLVGNSDMKRDQYRWSGTCQGATCAGWTVLTALYNATYQCDKENGTQYHERVKKYLAFVEDNALALAGAITDAKGNRAQKPSQQANPDSYLHIKERRPDGVIISGYKIQICGTAAAHELVFIPTSGYGADDADFCVAGAIPKDTEGITIIETRRPSDERDYHEGWDAPKVGNITQAYILFEDVFVPNERIFLCGEFKYTGMIIGDFAAIYRAAIGACVAGQGDIMCGAAINMARANGLAQKTFQTTLNEMAIRNEITYGLGLGAMLKGKKTEAGSFIPNALLAHTNKTQVAKLPYEVKVMAQDISGGIAETGCIPPYEDFQHPVYGKKLFETLAAGTDGESRARAARLVEWLTIGGGVPGCMHGGGSPDGAKLVVRAATKWENYAADAKRIAGITAELAEPAKK